MALVSVIGAAGRQGLAQMRQLSAAGYKVRALSRVANPDFGGANTVDEVRHFDLHDEASYAGRPSKDPMPYSTRARCWKWAAGRSFPLGWAERRIRSEQNALCGTHQAGFPTSPAIPVLMVPIPQR